MEVNSPSLFPLIEQYWDYRKFLKDYYHFKKNHRAGFSFRQFSAKAGLKSPNYLQLVIKGDRNLSEGMADSVAQAMDLSPGQKRYFVSLVQQENAKTDDELLKARDASLMALKKLVSKHIQKKEAHILTDWHFLLVRELVTLPNFEPSGDFISKKLKGLITPEMGEKALRVLLDSGFVQINQGKFEVKDSILDTGDTVMTDELIKKYHAKNLKVWSENLNLWNSKELELGVLNLSLPSRKVPELKQKIRDFQDQILGWLQSEKDLDSVVQVGVYMIPHVIKKTN